MWNRLVQRGMTEVLVIAREAVPALPEEGTWAFDPASLPDGCHWLERERAEGDETRLQLIPYLLLRDADGRLWSYRRAGGDRRLQDRLSCGVGGHVEPCDRRQTLLETLAAAAARELREELHGDPLPAIGEPTAWLYEGHSAVGRVHLGLIYTLHWEAEAAPRVRPGEALEPLGFLPPAGISQDERFELWSRLAAAAVEVRSR